MNADLRYADGSREHQRKSARKEREDFTQMGADKIRVNQREKKKKISRRWSQIGDTQMEADKIRVNQREKKRLFHADGRRLEIRRWKQIKSA